MKVNYKQLQKRILHSLLMSLVAAGAIACISEVNSTLTKSAIAKEVVSLDVPKPVPPDQVGYRSRLGFGFGYSLNSFVVEEKIVSRTNNVNSPLGTVDIWTKKHAQKIRAGEYAGGTEYPANVRVSVYRNSRKLPLQKWVKQSNQFVATSEFKTAKIAGQTGIKFKSSGLYENENIVFARPKDLRIIVVTLSKTGSGNDDANYQRAYQQLVESFRFINK
ncbi:hypothetical protein BV372_13255 [Nostoc sp. T09]|uniref:hypothetical protein n=1 Tax=Nostoc sp. T09 TaxID=1932621 RepID=UPI000A3D1AB5|nr:hypothetical protein [Nostoc sp. T09]OUL34810.1 hypothetical protein BV372_13255 [Nostoc sp. T09]